MFIEAGIDVLNPIESAAGMDLTVLKRKYGKKLAFMGGFDKRQFFDKAQVKKEIKTKLKAFPAGGLIACVDHSVGPDIPVENYEYYLKLVRGKSQRSEEKG
jgi:uroporphyrinogen decarboxylase